jgi:hypothetical protein
MKGMQKIQRGSGFRGCAEYLLDHDGGRVIGGNMCGMTARALSAEFGVARRQRLDIEKPVWHNSLRLPADERVLVDDEKWQEIADDYMRAMGFSDEHPRVYVLHDPDHVHILASRVGLDGSVYLGRNENLKSTALIQHLEQLHGLTVTKGPKRTEKGRIAPPEVRRMRVGERCRYERLMGEPAREELQRLVAEAAKGRPTASEFVARLQAQGVSVWPKFTGDKLDGFSFGLGKVAFTGQQLGDRYRWGRLKKAGVSYSPERDMGALAAARLVDPALIVELTELEPGAEVEAERTAPEPEVEQDRSALAEGLDLTTEELAGARRIEEGDESLVEREDWMTDGDYANALMAEKERIVFEAELEDIQAAMDSPEPWSEPGRKVKGPGCRVKRGQ